ncbi:ABC transporter permease [Candidatus Peregrinibacteria bacterium]|nr:ABC transporter permease [Candidatus Peregrinibacteria bacterium]
MQFFGATFTICHRELIRYWRDKVRILTTLIQPLMFLAIFGSGLKQTLAQGNFGVDFIQFMYPGIIAMNVMGVAFFSTVTTVWDREFGFLREMMVAPISRSSIAFGKTLGATVIASSQALILLVLAPFIGVKLDIITLPLLFLFMFLVALAISGMGLFISSMMRTMESFGLLMQILIFPMFFLSGAFFPLTSVPTWMSVIAKLNPLSYGVDAMRQILLGGQIPDQILAKFTINTIPVNGLFLLVFGLVAVSAAVVVFNKRG